MTTKAEIIATTTAKTIQTIVESGNFLYCDLADCFESSDYYCAFVRDRISSISFDLIWDSELDEDMTQDEEEAIFNAVKATVIAMQQAA